ncbi:MAG: exonuclease domain-containing protein [Clostridia bacterium]|nr:exonuclease domain-containing protein [Clostridia bacterium]
MYYITLDLEWNQAYAEKALAVQKRLCRRLRGEVIQIGAVKLDKNMLPCGSYQIIVKPKYFKKLHKHVSVLTGITQEQMDLGSPLAEAAEKFKKWCGKDFAFLTWGPDDIPMLKENLRAHDLAVDWLDENYDLQLIFNRQTDGASKQRSLEYAMEYFEIPQNLPAHDALNDAYFTALVAEKLDVEEGIKTYNQRSGILLDERVVGDADAGEDGYVTISELLDEDFVKAPVCPVCQRKLSSRLKMLHSKGQRYSYIYSCPTDGNMILSLKLHRNFNETWRAKLSFELADDARIEEFKRALDASNVKRKAKHRRSRRKTADTARQPAQETT